MIIHRQSTDLLTRIHRSGRNSRLPESSDNLPIDGRNLPMINRQVIVRCMPRIVRSYPPVCLSANPSTCHQFRRAIHQRPSEGRSCAPTAAQSIDNLSTDPRNPSIGQWPKQEKRSINGQENPGIDRFREVKSRSVVPHKSSDNLPMFRQNHPMGRLITMVPTA